MSAGSLGQGFDRLHYAAGVARTLPVDVFLHLLRLLSDRGLGHKNTRA